MHFIFENFNNSFFALAKVGIKNIIICDKNRAVARGGGLRGRGRNGVVTGAQI
jgi:hypothetical protein